MGIIPTDDIIEGREWCCVGGSVAFATIVSGVTIDIHVFLLLIRFAVALDGK